MREKTFNLVCKFGDIEIFECVENPPFEKSPFTYSLLGRHSSHYFDSIDEAVLGALGRKYDGLNSQFATFAVKMLGIK